MERIPWNDPMINGQTFETIVGCLLGLERQGAVRIRSAQGDGGVDILHPLEDGSVDVYQVKHYTKQVSWTKVKASLDSLVDAKYLDRPISNWYLTVPFQPTPAQMRRLLDLQADSSFPLRWFAEDRLSALTALHPEVGAYYLGDGRRRLDQALDQLDSAYKVVRAGASPRLSDFQQQLTDIVEALGLNDPHFEYGVEVHPLDHYEPNIASAAIAQQRVKVEDKIVVQTRYPRYRGADLDAKDRLQIGLELAPDAGARVADMLEVGGEPVELGPSDVLALDLPDVNTDDSTEWYIRLTPWADTSPASLRILVEPPGAEPLLVELSRTYVTPAATGFTSKWRSPHGAVELTAVIRRNEGHTDARAHFAWDLSGPVAHVAGDLALLRALRAGAQVSLMLPRGPKKSPLPPLALSEAIAPPKLVDLVDALRVIQDHTTDIVTIPETVTRRSADDIIETAAELAGLTTVTDIRGRTGAFHVTKKSLDDPTASVFDGMFGASYLTEPVTEVDLGHQVIQLAEPVFLVVTYRSVQVVRIDLPEDSDLAILNFEAGPVPLRVTQRVSAPEEFTDELSRAALIENDPIPVADLSEALAQL